MSKIVLIYSTTDGHTRKICSRLLEIIEKKDNTVTLVPVEKVDELDLNTFDKIVIGASIRYGKHSTKIYDFINKNTHILDNKPSAFFSVNVVARKPNRNRPETNPYLKRFLKQIPWKPETLAVFAGKIDYQKYKIWDRFMIRMIMWITKGPTHPETNIEFTDWDQVDSFGILICNM